MPYTGRTDLQARSLSCIDKSTRMVLATLLHFPEDDGWIQHSQRTVANAMVIGLGRVCNGDTGKVAEWIAKIDPCDEHCGMVKLRKRVENFDKRTRMGIFAASWKNT